MLLPCANTGGAFVASEQSGGVDYTLNALCCVQTLNETQFLFVAKRVMRAIGEKIELGRWEG